MINKHELWELKQMQAMPLEAKIQMTRTRIKDWYDAWDGNVYLSFSGGKDSTVLKHIIDQEYDNVQSMFVDTGLEYPEIREFIKSKKNVTIIRPEKKFYDVLYDDGYPLIGKEVAETIEGARRNVTWAMKQINGLKANGEESPYKKRRYSKYKYLVDAPFIVSHKCCYYMKKNLLVNLV